MRITRRSRCAGLVSLAILLCGPAGALSSQGSILNASRRFYQNFFNGWIESRDYCSSGPKPLQNYVETTPALTTVDEQRLWQRYPIFLGLCGNLADQIQSGSTREIRGIVEKIAELINHRYGIAGEFIGDGKIDQLVAAYSAVANRHQEQIAAAQRAQKTLNDGRIALNTFNPATDAVGNGAGVNPKKFTARPNNQPITAAYYRKYGSNGNYGNVGAGYYRQYKTGKGSYANVDPVQLPKRGNVAINAHDHFRGPGAKKRNQALGPSYSGDLRTLNQHIAGLLDHSQSAWATRQEAQRVVDAWRFSRQRRPQHSPGPKVPAGVDASLYRKILAQTNASKQTIPQEIHALQYYLRICMEVAALQRLERARQVVTLSTEELRISNNLQRDVSSLRNLLRSLGIGMKNSPENIKDGFLTEAQFSVNAP